MKGDTAMKKLDLISDEYIREAEIPEDLDVIVTPKRGFWKGFVRFMNSPVGVAMLCAVVSLSVLFAVVMAGQNGWGKPDPSTPAGSLAESESRQTNHETEIITKDILPEGTEIKLSYSKELVPEFLQALSDTGVMLSDYVKQETYNVTPPEVFAATDGRIFDTTTQIYLWLNEEIYPLNFLTFYGTSLMSAILCDYDLNGTHDILFTYADHLSGTSNDRIAIFDMEKKQVLPYKINDVIGIWGVNGTIVYKRQVNKQIFYDIYNTNTVSKDETGWLMEIWMFRGTLIPSSDGQMKFITAEKMETEPSPPITDIPGLVPTVFSQYMDGYGFVGELSESDFVIGVLSQFSYEGQPLSELPITSGSGELPDGGFTSTIFYEDEHGGLEFGYTSMIPTYTNERSEYGLRTQTALEGFALPYGMVWGDTLEAALKKLDVEISTPPVASGETLLYQVGNKSLCLVSDREATVPYRLVFKETVTSSVSAYRSATVERTLTLSFGQDLKLFEVKIDVTTQYATATLQDPDIGVLSPAVVTEIKQAFLMQNVPEADQAFYSMDDLSIRYYGTYNGGYAVFVDGIFDYNQAFEYETVLGIEFEYSSEQKLLYYKNGQFYALPEAASTGLLSQADIERLYLVYTGR